MTLREDFAYVDRQNRSWKAPTGVVVDGASIPAAFWTFILRGRRTRRTCPQPRRRSSNLPWSRFASSSSSRLVSRVRLSTTSNGPGTGFASLSDTLASTRKASPQANGPAPAPSASHVMEKCSR